jgi:hypothetical protein
VVIDGDRAVGQVPVPLPIIHRGVVQVPQGDRPLPIGGALIRAYALRDPSGAFVEDPEAPVCEPGSAGESSCVRSVLQVAETRARDDGSFDLVLPARLE